MLTHAISVPAMVCIEDDEKWECEKINNKINFYKLMYIMYRNNTYRRILKYCFNPNRIRITP